MPSGNEPAAMTGPEADDARIDEWRRQICVIRDELTYMNHRRSVMLRVTEVWNGNARLLNHPGRGVVLDTMREYFGVWLAMALRREIDGADGSVSLLNLLRDIAEHAESFTESQMRRLWNDPTGWYTRHTFSQYANPTGQHLNADIPRNDAERLRTTADSLRLFVNRNLAHRSTGPAVAAPTFDDLHSLAETYEAIAKPYVLLLTGAAFSFTPVEQFQWIDIFDFPWRSPT